MFFFIHKKRRQQTNCVDITIVKKKAKNQNYNIKKNKMFNQKTWAIHHCNSDLQPVPLIGQFNNNMPDLLVSTTEHKASI